MNADKTYWTDLRYSVIIGYIDGYDAVHSILISGKNYIGQTHEDMFGPCLRGWRWDYDRGMDFSILCSNIDFDDADSIRNHLTDRYRIPFYDNGYHDVQFFVKMMNSENKK